MALLKKLLSGMLALFIILGTSAAESELLQNGDFEKGLPNGLVLKNAAIVNEGGKVLKLEGKDSSAVIKGIKTEPGQRYKLSFQAKAGAKTLTGNGYQSFRVYVSWQDTERKEGTEWLDSFPEGYQAKTLIFNAPMCNKPMIISCELKDAGSIYLDNFKLEALSPEKLPDLKISVDKPFYRNIIYSSDPVSEIAGSVSANENVASAELKFSEKDSGKVLFGKKFANINGKFEFSIPAEDLEYGKYILSVIPFAKDGKALDKVETPIWKLEKGPMEIIYKKDLNCYINNSIFFPIVFYKTGIIVSNKSVDDDMRAAFYHARKNGVNTFIIWVGPKSKTVLNLLNAAAEFDCKLILSLGSASSTDKEVFKNWQHNILNVLRPEIIAHKALFGYFLTDEPMWGGVPLETLRVSYDFIKEIDSYRPININEAPRGTISDLNKYSAYADIWGTDIYPVPAPSSHSNLEDRTITCVGKYTQIFRNSVNQRKPIWMVLQAFSWGTFLGRKPEIYPTVKESEFMAFDCLVNGAQSIGFWGIYCINNPQFYEVLFSTTKKLAALSGVITLPTIDNIVKCNSSEIKFLTKEKDGNIYIIAVNESNKEVAPLFIGTFGSSSVKVVSENRSIPCNNGFKDSFSPYGCHVYATGDLPEPIIKSIPLNEEMEEKGSPFIKNVLLRQCEYKGNAQWIWFPGKSNTAFSKAAFEKKISVNEIPAKAEIAITADDNYVLSVNGSKVGEDDSGYDIAECYDITSLLKKGVNTIYIEAADAGMPPCGLFVDISLLDSNGKTSNILSDSSWKTKEIEKFSDCPPAEFKGINSAKVADYGHGPWISVFLNK